MKTALTAVLIAILVAGCASAPNPRLSRLTMIEKVAASEYDKGKLSSNQYLRILLGTQQSRQEILANRERSNRAFAIDMANRMDRQSQQRIELFKASRLQPIRPQPAYMGTHCATNVYGQTAYTNCY